VTHRNVVRIAVGSEHGWLPQACPSDDLELKDETTSRGANRERHELQSERCLFVFTAGFRQDLKFNQTFPKKPSRSHVSALRNKAAGDLKRA
jgi:hypothetical protein